MFNHQISDQQRQIVKQLSTFIIPWRKLTIGIDGPDGAGKSVLARFLAWFELGRHIKLFVGSRLRRSFCIYFLDANMLFLSLFISPPLPSSLIPSPLTGEG